MLLRWSEFPSLLILSNHMQPLADGPLAGGVASMTAYILFDSETMAHPGCLETVQPDAAGQVQNLHRR